MLLASCAALLVAGSSLLGTSPLPDPWRPPEPRIVPPPVASCELRASSTRVRPGDVALLVLTCDTAPEGASITLAGAPLLLFPFPGDAGSNAPGSVLAAVLGIDVAASAGSRTIRWRAKLPGGGAEAGTLVLDVEPRDFPTQRIKVAPRFDALDAKTLARTAEEQRRMLEVLGRRSPERLWRGAFAAPVSGAGSGFGSRRVVNGNVSSPHSGLDIGAVVGTPVQAANAGVVVLADTLFFAGGTVVLDHGLGLFTIYSHLSAILVSPGERVEKGQSIARSGATGRVTGPHVHWAARAGGARVDPTVLVSVTRAAASPGPGPTGEIVGETRNGPSP